MTVTRSRDTDVSLLVPDCPEMEPLQADLLIREARRRQRRRRLAVAGVAIAVLSGVAIARTDAASPGHARLHSRPRQVASPAPSGGLILHIDWTTTQINTGQPTSTYQQEVYEETSPPYLTRTIDKSLLGTPAGTEGTSGIGTGEQIYDPTNNTIYDPPTPPAPPGERTLTPAQEAQMFKPYMSQYVQRLRAQLASGEARVDGPATVDGRAAIKITFANSDEIDYVAPDGSDVPVETIQGTPSSTDGQIINVYHTFEYLPAAGNMGLLSLTVQHPGAQVDTSLSDFRAANNQLFPNGG